MLIAGIIIPQTLLSGRKVFLIFPKSETLSAHAHRHTRHDKIVVCQKKRVHGFRVLFLSSPVFPGIRFWHRFPPVGGLVARVSMSLISPPFLIKIKHPLMEGIFDS